MSKTYLWNFPMNMLHPLYCTAFNSQGKPIGKYNCTLQAWKKTKRSLTAIRITINGNIIFLWLSSAMWAQKSQITKKFFFFFINYNYLFNKQPFLWFEIDIPKNEDSHSKLYEIIWKYVCSYHEWLEKSWKIQEVLNVSWKAAVTLCLVMTG